MDINGDGFIDLPVEYREDYAQEASEKIFFLQYMSCAGTETKPVWNGIANTEGGYLFAVPESWNEKISAAFGNSADELIFTDVSTGETILEICSVLKSDYQDKYEDYIFAAEDETKNYYVKILAGPESEFGASPEDFKNSFIFR